MSAGSVARFRVASICICKFASPNVDNDIYVSWDVSKSIVAYFSVDLNAAFLVLQCREYSTNLVRMPSFICSLIPCAYLITHCDQQRRMVQSALRFFFFVHNCGLLSTLSPNFASLYRPIQSKDSSKSNTDAFPALCTKCVSICSKFDKDCLLIVKNKLYHSRD